MKFTWHTLLSLAVLAGLSVVGSGGCSSSSQKLNIGGSSFVAPMMEKWISEYEKGHQVKINYNSVGSGTGVKNMIDQTFDFGCSDAPMNEQQLEDAKKKNGDVVHIPLVMGAVVPCYNLPGVDKPLVFSGPVLADIYLGKITKWNDKALEELNPGVSLPDKAIAVAFRGDASGTSHIFTDYLSKVSPTFKEKVGNSTQPKIPVGSGYPKNDGVAGFVKSTEGAIGYVELIYALENNIKYGSVKNQAGEPILGSLASVTAAADGSLTKIPDDLRYSIVDAPGKEAYPISGTVWAVVYVNQPAAKKQAVVDYLKWITHDGQQYCEQLRYAKLPPGLVERIDKKLAEIKAK